MIVPHLVGPTVFPSAPPPSAGEACSLSVLSWNVLLPNSQDGWWTYKMYLPPLAKEKNYMASWDFRRDLIQQRIATVDADVVCFQEVSPLSFETDFAFMEDLGYDGKEMFRKGRFRPATFWKTSVCDLVAPPVHKDRTLLTAFKLKQEKQNPSDTTKQTTSDNESTATEDNNQKQKQNKKNKGKHDNRYWFVLNCHLQAAKQGSRRVRQINEGCRAVMTLARKLKIVSQKSTEAPPLIVCGDFNGGSECGAIRYLEDGQVDETFLEDGEPVVSKVKAIPFSEPLTDVASIPPSLPSQEDDKNINKYEPPNTLIVPELISIMIKQSEEDDVEKTAYENPTFSQLVLDRLERIYGKYATHSHSDDRNDQKVMKLKDVEQWLIAINGEVGRGSEFREAAKQMGWTEPDEEENGNDSDDNSESDSKTNKPRITLPTDENAVLTFDSFVHVYEKELQQGKFWGIAHDLAVLGEPLPDAGVFQSRFDRLYCNANVIKPTYIMDFTSIQACPNEKEPSDHLPVAAKFHLIQ